MSLRGNWSVLGKNTVKYKTFSVPIEKEVAKIGKDCSERVVTMSYKIMGKV